MEQGTPNNGINIKYNSFNPIAVIPYHNLPIIINSFMWNLLKNRWPNNTQAQAGHILGTATGT